MKCRYTLLGGRYERIKRKEKEPTRFLVFGCDSSVIHYRTQTLLYLVLRILGFWMQLLCHFMVSQFYAYEMQVFMNQILNTIFYQILELQSSIESSVQYLLTFSFMIIVMPCTLEITTNYNLSLLLISNQEYTWVCLNK